ncbi:hypothetical protein CC80DRAFT_557980 [Byssothecium circinans]|uniref:Extensin domain-containing protein n=1 Tax=Byssothecium circinans TaxID=147558 RepID=A0A6A5U3R7_9PLEO|nr:hypothetical protein CC80DRAFT_557980 [Byssothecium circinans]
MFNLPRNAHDTLSEEDLLGDVDEPPDLERTPRPSALSLHESSKAAFSKSTLRSERKESLLTTALHSNGTSPVEEQTKQDPTRGRSCASTWSNNSTSTAELTSDGGFTSSGTRTRTPSPPLPSTTFHNMAPAFNKSTVAETLSIMHHDEDSVIPLQKATGPTAAGEHVLEATLGRKRCISFACGAKSEKRAEPKQMTSPPEPIAEPPKRACTIKFACPTKISTAAPSKDNKPRRTASPAPPAHRSRASPKSPRIHRGSDSTVRNPSPIATRKSPANRTRRLTFRFHEFASSEEEVQEWTLESTCHRRPLTIKDTLRVENGLRQLGEEAEEEALDDEDEEDNLDDIDQVELDDDEEEDLDGEDSDAHDDISSDEGFQTDDEGGFAGSDDESDAGSDYNWWAPGRSTAATSIEHLDLIRPISRRSISESSIGSLDSGHRYKPKKMIKRRQSRPVNIRIPSPELPDSTDFVCGTLDEDQPLEEAYLSALERRRAAKHKRTPQDVDPTFPTSDPELSEEDEVDEPDQAASESDQFLMMHGQMDLPKGDLRGRRKTGATKRSPAQSPKRLRSPPPPAKRIAHRSPPRARQLFGQSPKPLRSPPAPARLRSPPPTRRGSSHMISPRRPSLSIQFAGLAERPAPTTSTSLPRTPIVAHVTSYFDDDEDEDTPNEFPIRRAIDIKVGLEKKRQRRKEQLYKKKHGKNIKEKRPPPGKGCERMREVGLGLAAHKGTNVGFAFNVPPTPDKNDIHVLSV